MTLVKNDDLEIAVAIAGIVSKVSGQFALPVMQLTRRIDTLCANRTVTERLNPLGPRKLGEAFVGAIEGVEIDIRVRIVLLKLFERFVMEHLGHAYEHANRMLAEAGVLPDLRNVMKREVNAQTPAPEQLPNSIQDYAGSRADRRIRWRRWRDRWIRPAPGTPGANDFTMLQQLLAAQPGGGTGGGIGGAMGYGGSAASGGAPGYGGSALPATRGRPARLARCKDPGRSARSSRRRS